MLPAACSGWGVRATPVVLLPARRTAGLCCSTATTEPTSSLEKKASGSTTSLCTRRWAAVVFIFISSSGRDRAVPRDPGEPFLASCRGAGPPCPSSSRRFRPSGRSSSSSQAFAASPCTTTRPILWWAGPGLRSGGQT